MSEYKNWYNAIPLNKWMRLYDPEDNTKLVFKLRHYEIINGAPKWELEEIGGAVHEGSVGQVTVRDLMQVRLFSPIEFVKLRGYVVSVPKLIFSINREWLIEQYDSDAEKARSDSTYYNASRQHPMRGIKL